MTNFETPEWDAAEQAEQYGERAESPTEPDEPFAGATLSDADPADLAEQHMVVPDDEEYEHG
ncbi:hypothetical protein SAMN04487820_1139 [Actinopolyspora mzabensis]|uniref:Uncharacterized protein n=1 Tax=Actinopolyspora mzabensis TaxID=995066 RepID=A0A1G9EU82_ACTMZ|nr:hypothetical protein [Actinopolyspora mzabensis]SDK79680.1 hypothetical protein SAMN04487820_1139 [Actinopolyspora mzabensis]